MKKFEVSFPYFLEYPVKVVVKKIGVLGFFGWVFQKYGKRLIKNENIFVTERIVEVPSTYSLLVSFSKPGESVLEIGHVNSSLSLELASLGYKMTAIDLRPYPFSHQNLASIQGNFLEYNFQNKFKAIITISTIEHFGYNKRYGGAEEGAEDLDKKAFQKIHDLLASDGKCILTIPYAAKYRSDTWFKTYTRETLKNLLEPFFTFDSQSFYVRKEGQWLPASGSDDPEYPYDGVAIFLLSKRLI